MLVDVLIRLNYKREFSQGVFVGELVDQLPFILNCSGYYQAYHMISLSLTTVQ